MSKNWSEVLGISQEAIKLLQRFHVDLDAFYEDSTKEKKVREILDFIMTEDSCTAFVLWAQFHFCHDPHIRKGAKSIIYSLSQPHEIIQLEGVWPRVPLKAREFFIRFVFERFPGEPFETLENLSDSLKLLRFPRPTISLDTDLLDMENLYVQHQN
jgi:hypothetical protein